MALDLDSVLFAPVGTQPLKPLGSTASFADRVAMTELAIQDEPKFAISLVDAPTAEKAHHYTIGTLLRLRAELLPGAELYCLMGADSFHNLPFWHRGGEIPFASCLIVAARPGQRLEDLNGDLPSGLSIDRDFTESSEPGGVHVRKCTIRSEQGAHAPFFLLPGLNVDISASEIRHHIQSAQSGLGSGRDFLTGPVSDYIAAHGLYR